MIHFSNYFELISNKMSRPLWKTRRAWPELQQGLNIQSFGVYLAVVGKTNYVSRKTNNL